MTQEDRIQDDLNAISDRISTTVRSVSLGVLALAWLFIAGSKDASALISLATYKWQLLAIAAVCVIALLLDLAQYFCGYQCSYNALLDAESTDDEEASEQNVQVDSKSYDFTEAYHVWRRRFFWAKQVAAAVATFWMLGLIFIAVSTTSGTQPDKKTLALEVSDLVEIVGAARQSEAVQRDAGRYQLFQGWYRFINLKGEESRTETLFKIDTATGEIFECSSVQFVQDGKGTQKTACLPFEGHLSLGPGPAQK